MARRNPSLPHPSAKVVDTDGQLMREWRDTLAAIIDRVPVLGTATFAAATSVVVTLTPPEKDANYQVAVEFPGTTPRAVSITSKTTTSFTINSASNSDTVRWALMRF